MPALTKPLQKAVTLTAIVCSFGAAVVIAQRIITNPKPDAHLKQLFPAAAAFSTLGGEPLHFTAYAADPKTTPSAQPIGYAFWTTDVVPNEHGYHGPIHLLVGLDLKGTPKFSAQFKGKTIRDGFVVGRDIDAVSRATISISSATRAVRDSARLAAQKLLPPEALK
jgi:NosR/NirI family nitrous oxide reductase transcriptional regulator